MVLLLIALAVALFAVLSLALTNMATIEHRAVTQSGHTAQLVQIVHSGIDAAAQAIDCPTRPNLFDNPGRFGGIEVVPAHLTHHHFGAGRFTVFSPRVENEQVQGVRFGLTRESAKLSIEAVLAWENESPGWGEQALRNLPGITPEAIDSILDWLDADDDPRPQGAEAEWYREQDKHYTPRNAAIVTLEELLLIRGVERQMVFGDDHLFAFGVRQSTLRQVHSALDGVYDPFAPVTTMPHGGEQESYATYAATAWQFLVTPYSAEKLVNSEWVVRIHLNEPNLEFLESQMRLHQLDQPSIDFILAWRNTHGNINDPLDLLDVELPGIEMPLDSPLPTDGFIAPAPTQRAYTFSLSDAGTLSRRSSHERFLRLLDEAVTDPAIVVRGRINVNEAPRVVLEAVPELTPQMVTAILERRNPDNEAHRHAVWLLAEGIVDLETMRTLSRRLTTGGDVYRAHVAGFFEGQRMFHRAEVVLDATVKPPRVVFYNDLTPLAFPE